MVFDRGVCVCVCFYAAVSLVLLFNLSIYLFNLSIYLFIYRLLLDLRVVSKRTVHPPRARIYTYTALKRGGESRPTLLLPPPSPEGEGGEREGKEEKKKKKRKKRRRSRNPNLFSSLAWCPRVKGRGGKGEREGEGGKDSHIIAAALSPSLQSLTGAGARFPSSLFIQSIAPFSLFLSLSLSFSLLVLVLVLV